MNLPDDYIWDQGNLDEDALSARLDVMGRGLITCFGHGSQGVVYMTEEGSFAKITISRAEAAMARFLMKRSLVSMPIVDDVYSFDYGEDTLYVIYREPIDDVLEDDIDRKFLLTVRMAWVDLHLSSPSNPHSANLLKVEEVSPELYHNMIELNANLEELASFEGFTVTDLALDNIGRAKSGEMIVRDFGMHTLPKDQILALLAEIPELPQPMSFRM